MPNKIFTVTQQTIKRIITALISAIIFSFIVSLFSYTPLSQREPNVLYFEISDTFVFTLMYVIPVYILIGIPISYGIDKLSKNQTQQSVLKAYLSRVVMYAIAGLVPGFMFYILFNDGFSYFSLHLLITMMLYGILASNLFFHTLLILNKIIITKRAVG